MALEGMRNFIARHVVRDVKTYKIDDFRTEPPKVVKIKCRAETQAFRPEIKITASKPFNIEKISKKIQCNAKRFQLAFKPVQSRNQKIKSYVKQDVKVHTFSFNKKIRTFSQLKQIQAMPQERKNMLKFQKKRPNIANNEMLLAWYGPIVEGAVEKLVLNKQRGTLLIWYKPSSRQIKARGVYLIRRLGMSSKPEWRWS